MNKMPKKIALIGVNGQVGQYLLSCLGCLDTDTTVEIIGLSRQELDLTKTDDIPLILNEITPDLIINASAYTAVDKAESEPELAYQVNCVAPQAMAEYAKQNQVPFIHFSTDYVFAGDASEPYLEDEITNPQGEYGSSKLAGEQAVLASGAKAFIFRTAWVYSQKGNNFYKTMLKLAESRSELNIVDDQVGSPTYAAAIAQATTEIVKKIFSSGDFSSGVYHMTCQGKTHWADFAQEIFTLNGCEIDIHGIPSSEYPTPAKRPNFSVLDNQKLFDVFGINLPHWRDALLACVEEKSA